MRSHGIGGWCECILIMTGCTIILVHRGKITPVVIRMTVYTFCVRDLKCLGKGRIAPSLMTILTRDSRMGSHKLEGREVVVELFSRRDIPPLICVARDACLIRELSPVRGLMTRYAVTETLCGKNDRLVLDHTSHFGVTLAARNRDMLPGERELRPGMIEQRSRCPHGCPVTCLTLQRNSSRMSVCMTTNARRAEAEKRFTIRFRNDLQDVRALDVLLCMAIHTLDRKMHTCKGKARFAMIERIWIPQCRFHVPPQMVLVTCHAFLGRNVKVIPLFRVNAFPNFDVA